MSTWWYVSDGERKGPVSDEELHRLLISGAVAPTSLVWKEGMQSWQPAAQVEALAATLASLPPEIPQAQNTPQLTTKAGARWPRVRRHLGSTLALILGCLTLIAGVSNTVSDPSHAGGLLIAGPVMILGALA